jgi:putative ABC transport system ATP-binding protein
MPNMSEPIISVEHVHKSVTDSTGTLDILRDIDFSLAARETAAIVGASGSGKSTLAVHHRRPGHAHPGTVRWRAGPVRARRGRPRRAAARQVGFVFQSFQLMGNLSALENVMLPLELAGRKRRAQGRHRDAGRVGLGERLGHYPRCCRAASSSAWRWRGPSWCSRPCCWPTSPPAASTSPPARP